MAAAQASTGMFCSWLLVPEQGARAKMCSSELEQSSEVFDGFKVPVWGPLVRGRRHVPSMLKNK